MTFNQMRQELDRLQGLRFPPADYRTHWDGLQGIPLGVLTRAVGRAAATCQDFPTPAELRVLADALGPSVGVAEDRSVPLAEPVMVTAPFLSKPIPVAREWRYYCDTCSDTGWDSVWCGSEPVRYPWLSRWDCGRTMDHAPHEWVRRCQCYTGNPDLVRKRESQAKYAASRTAGRKGE